MVDLKLLYHDLVRFEMELWGAVDARLRAECDLQLTWFEVMRLLGRRGGCRVLDIAEEFGITVGGPARWSTGSRPPSTAGVAPIRTTGGLRSSS
ncbi:hypothetical protein [Amycolatopsis vastitatis]|uniref:hypothetical protein n=1 Tax=Amycolatopsis vastitatis TaxID=1905142 RepID=UPI00196B0043|nr:hypothetical protein [Amycolatopsis vastitatis]